MFIVVELCPIPTWTTVAGLALVGGADVEGCGSSAMRSICKGPPAHQLSGLAHPLMPGTRGVFVYNRRFRTDFRRLPLAMMRNRASY